MATRITGLDLGTYSIKVVHLEVQRDLRVIGYDEERVLVAEVAPVPGVAGVAGVASVSDFDDEATSVRPAPVEGADGVANNDWLEPESFEAELDPLADAPGWVRALNGLAKRGNFEGQWVVTCLPNGKAMTIHVEVPFDSKQKVTSILPHLLMDRLPLDPRAVVYDFVVGAGAKPEQHEAIVGFARKEEMATFLEDTRSCGVDPVVVGVPELMLRYVAERAAPMGTGSYAVLDIGHTYTRLLVVNEGQPILARAVRMAGHDITEAIARRFNISYEDAEKVKHARGAILPATDAEDPAMLALSESITGALGPLVRELRRSFQSLFAQSRVKVENIYIMGGSSRLKNLVGFLEAEFMVPTERFHLEHNVILADLPAAERHAASIGLGLSLALQQAVDRQEKKLVNLRQGEFSFRGKSSFVRGQLTRIGIAAAVLVCFLAVFLATQRMEQRAQMEAMRSAVLKQSTELFGEPLDTQQKIQARLTGEAGSDRGFVPKMSAYELMYNLISRMSSDVTVVLDRIEVDTDRNLVQIVGVTSNPQAVDRLASDLEQLKCLREVRKDRLQVRSETEVQFELHISSGCS
ncbi:MAG: pilus assembly protein PilM [Bradymonadaceae bacterium]|nr:pilus assembly protein PilM [Lujinxingiaceae bacterium]